ncbi:MAG: aspartyl protease family protein [Phenylobacterium sp.]
MLFAALAAAPLALAASQAAAECKFQKLVEVPVTMEGLRPTVPAAVNGHDTRFMIDTGAFFSIVSNDAAERFSMRKSVAPFGLEIRGLGGTSRDASAVTADNFTFAGAGFKNIQFLVGGRAGEGETSGLIGQNIMGGFDVEYDFANGVMRFFKAEGCEKKNLAYWSKDMPLQKLNLQDQGRYVLEVLTSAQVNGRTIKVKWDTGASVSYLSRRAAARVGIEINNENVTAAGVSYGLYGRGIDTFRAPFASFKVGDEEIKNTQLRIADIEMGEHGDMLLGADFFMSHRVLVSSSQKAVYFTYNGGPVFRLDRPAGIRQAQAEPTPAPMPSGLTPVPTPGGGPDAVSKPAGAPGGTLTAAELGRRAAASAARRDFAAAIADYTRAIELDPNDGAAYQARARARLANRQPVLAMADLNQALRLQPNDVQAHLLRAQVYLGSRQLDGAKADFDAAQKLAPQNVDLPAEIGLSYARAGLYELALKQLDGWIADHPKSENLGRVLAARCWTRALSGKDLAVALPDCDRALQLDRNSQVMAYRGLVLFRMGRLDEAISQYSAAIRAQPRSAPALYGRGLAELKKGAKTEGEADIAAAQALAPGLAQEYRRFGLSRDEPAPASKPAA